MTVSTSIHSCSSVSSSPVPLSAAPCKPAANASIPPCVLASVSTVEIDSPSFFENFANAVLFGKITCRSQANGVDNKQLDAKCNTLSLKWKAEGESVQLLRHLLDPTALGAGCFELIGSLCFELNAPFSTFSFACEVWLLEVPSNPKARWNFDSKESTTSSDSSRLRLKKRPICGRVFVVRPGEE